MKSLTRARAQRMLTVPQLHFALQFFGGDLELIPNIHTVLLKQASVKCNMANVQLSLCTPWWHVGRARCIAPCIFNLGTRWRCVVSFMPRLLYPPKKNRPYPLKRIPGGAKGYRVGPKRRFGRSGEEKTFVPLPGIEPLTQSLHRLYESRQTAII